ncbi:MAG TPA: nucleotidyltransferase domain-containing protein [Ignavibacteria bacterium]|nr:nucleotidyltransferase domain-containing protein [Ignavibacteria bacterium]HMQ98755.1 nucleotidyltransferase domain-containing protein [Ignavibacteria bacterium]
MIPEFTLLISLKKASIEMFPDDKLVSIKQSLVNLFGSELNAIVLTGSYAKGDYHSESDIDLWVILGSLEINDLKEIAEIMKKNARKPEINIQCITSDELLTNSFKKFFSPVQLYVDGIVLHGKLPSYIPYNSEIRNYSASIASEVFMSSRHYITAGESEENLSAGRLLKWVIKPLSWVFRYNVLLKSSLFPRTFEDLTMYTSDEKELKIIGAYTEILDRKFNGSFISLNELCHQTSLKLSKI